MTQSNLSSGNRMKNPVQETSESVLSRKNSIPTLTSSQVEMNRLNAILNGPAFATFFAKVRFAGSNKMSQEQYEIHQNSNSNSFTLKEIINILKKYAGSTENYFGSINNLTVKDLLNNPRSANYRISADEFPEVFEEVANLAKKVNLGESIVSPEESLQNKILFKAQQIQEKIKASLKESVPTLSQGMRKAYSEFLVRTEDAQKYIGRLLPPQINLPKINKGPALALGFVLLQQMAPGVALATENGRSAEAAFKGGVAVEDVLSGKYQVEVGSNVLMPDGTMYTIAGNGSSTDPLSNTLDTLARASQEQIASIQDEQQQRQARFERNISELVSNANLTTILGTKAEANDEISDEAAQLSSENSSATVVRAAPQSVVQASEPAPVQPQRAVPRQMPQTPPSVQSAQPTVRERVAQATPEQVASVKAQLKTNTEARNAANLQKDRPVINQEQANAQTPVAQPQSAVQVSSSPAPSSNSSAERPQVTTSQASQLNNFSFGGSPIRGAASVESVNSVRPNVAQTKSTPETPNRVNTAASVPNTTNNNSLERSRQSLTFELQRSISQYELKSIQLSRDNGSETERQYVRNQISALRAINDQINNGAISDAATLRSSVNQALSAVPKPNNENQAQSSINQKPQSPEQVSAGQTTVSQNQQSTNVVEEESAPIIRDSSRDVVVIPDLDTLAQRYQVEPELLSTLPEDKIEFLRTTAQSQDAQQAALQGGMTVVNPNIAINAAAADVIIQELKNPGSTTQEVVQQTNVTTNAGARLEAVEQSPLGENKITPLGDGRYLISFTNITSETSQNFSAPERVDASRYEIKETQTEDPNVTQLELRSDDGSVLLRFRRAGDPEGTARRMLISENSEVKINDFNLHGPEAQRVLDAGINQETINQIAWEQTGGRDSRYYRRQSVENIVSPQDYQLVGANGERKSLYQFINEVPNVTSAIEGVNAGAMAISQVLAHADNRTRDAMIASLQSSYEQIISNPDSGYSDTFKRTVFALKDQGLLNENVTTSTINRARIALQADQGQIQQRENIAQLANELASLGREVADLEGTSLRLEEYNQSYEYLQHRYRTDLAEARIAYRNTGDPSKLIELMDKLKGLNFRSNDRLNTLVQNHLNRISELSNQSTAANQETANLYSHLTGGDESLRSTIGSDGNPDGMTVENYSSSLSLDLPNLATPQGIASAAGMIFGLLNGTVPIPFRYNEHGKIEYGSEIIEKARASGLLDSDNPNMETTRISLIPVLSDVLADPQVGPYIREALNFLGIPYFYGTETQTTAGANIEPLTITPVQIANVEQTANMLYTIDQILNNPEIAAKLSQSLPLTVGDVRFVRTINGQPLTDEQLDNLIQVVRSNSIVFETAANSAHRAGTIGSGLSSFNEAIQNPEVVAAINRLDPNLLENLSVANPQYRGIADGIQARIDQLNSRINGNSVITDDRTLLASEYGVSQGEINSIINGIRSGNISNIPGASRIKASELSQLSNSSQTVGIYYTNPRGELASDTGHKLGFQPALLNGDASLIKVQLSNGKVIYYDPKCGNFFEPVQPAELNLGDKVCITAGGCPEAIVPAIAFDAKSAINAQFSVANVPYVVGSLSNSAEAAQLLYRANEKSAQPSLSAIRANINWVTNLQDKEGYTAQQQLEDYITANRLDRISVSSDSTVGDMLRLAQKDRQFAEIFEKGIFAEDVVAVSLSYDSSTGFRLNLGPFKSEQSSRSVTNPDGSVTEYTNSSSSGSMGGMFDYSRLMEVVSALQSRGYSAAEICNLLKLEILNAGAASNEEAAGGGAKISVRNSSETTHTTPPPTQAEAPVDVIEGAPEVPIAPAPTPNQPGTPEAGAQTGNGASEGVVTPPAAVVEPPAPQIPPTSSTTPDGPNSPANPVQPGVGEQAPGGSTGAVIPSSPSAPNNTPAPQGPIVPGAGDQAPGGTGTGNIPGNGSGGNLPPNGGTGTGTGNIPGNGNGGNLPPSGGTGTGNIPGNGSGGNLPPNGGGGTGTGNIPGNGSGGNLPPNGGTGTGTGTGNIPGNGNGGNLPPSGGTGTGNIPGNGNGGNLPPSGGTGTGNIPQAPETGAVEVNPVVNNPNAPK